MDLKKYEEMIKILSPAVERHPEDLTCLATLGIAYQMVGEMEIAFHVFVRCLQEEGFEGMSIHNAVVMHCLHCFLHSNLESYDLEKIVSRALELYPNDPDVNLYTPKWYHRTGNLKKAIQCAERSYRARKDPNTKDIIDLLLAIQYDFCKN